MNFILNTNTNLSEVARVRHQIAELLINDGHNVLFISKKTHNHVKFTSIHSFTQSPNFTSITINKLHPKLRLPCLSLFLSFLDSLRIFFAVKTWLRSLPPGQVKLINFCHEIFHLPLLLRSISHSPFIHDNFVLQQRSIIFRFILRCQLSTVLRVYKNHHILCSSKSIEKQVLDIVLTASTNLFYPWINPSLLTNLISSVNLPPTKHPKSILLYWGQNHFLDFDFYNHLSRIFTTLGL